VTPVFWSIIALIAYVYVGYPVAVVLAGTLLDRRVRKATVFPRMSVIIAAHDEAPVIGARIQNVLEATYPVGRLEIIVASDGSGDRTAIEAKAVDPRVRVLDLPRMGKARALAEAARLASGDVLVFSDANTVFRPDALGTLAMSFADPDVGGVAGRTTYASGDDAEATDHGEGLYWKYDTWLKSLETRTGSAVSAHGGLYAVRCELFRPVEDLSVTDDFAISTAVVDQGKRLVFEPRAVATEATMGRGEVEFQRRVRLMTRGIRGVILRRGLLNPLRHGFFAVALASRKVARRLLPLTFPALFAVSVMLAGESPLYLVAALGQALLLALAGIGWAMRRSTVGRSPILYIPLFFCMANLASVLALWNVARGHRIERWTPQRHEVVGGQIVVQGESHVE
jgi:cellulose synthase/poly-beta-1,6-N-acetylglucosamine synthase-like glycosyltransferase